LREVIGGIERTETRFFAEATELYMRDLYDHTIQAMDTIETFRDTLSSTVDIYMSSISNRLNEIMKVLTIIATIFIPLTFVTSLYGMNFHYMPELSWRWGYPAVLLAMLVVAVGMLAYFRNKRWM
jgi:magnesium transporter